MKNNNVFPFMPAIHGIGQLVEKMINKDLSDVRFEDIFTHQSPAVNIQESDAQYLMDIAAPGMQKKDFEIQIDNNLLIVSAKRKKEEDQENDNFYRREFNYREFKRSFRLPDSVESNKISASYENGILRISLPKTEQEIKKTQTIKIS